jgi:predicted TIM-barrel fold metal-dependent hydrolase
MTVIDSHFHVWRQADLPWLSGPMQPRIFGAYDALRRDYPMAEYLSDSAGQGVVKAVYVQVNWAPAAAAEEVAWVSRIAHETGWPHGIVGFADVTATDVRPALDRLMTTPLLRGIRHQLHHHANPQYRFAPRADLCDDARVQANVARLANYGLSFDLQVFADQMPGAARLARACPRTTLILQHAGMLEDTSPDGRATWAQGMRLLAACPNVVVKMSGFGTFVHRVDPDLIAWLWRETLALFGPQRCLWGSNYPIEKLWTGYAPLLAAHQIAVATWAPADAGNVFHDTAQRIYRL